MRRFRIFHAWFTQVPDGTSPEDLPSLVGDHAISRLELCLPDTMGTEISHLACRGRLWEEGLVADEALTFIQEASC